MHPGSPNRLMGGAPRPLAFGIAFTACLASVAGETIPPDRQATVVSSPVDLESTIPFDGLGLEGFEGVGSIASELLHTEAAAIEEEAWALDMAVSGPGGSARIAGSTLAGDVAAPVPLKATIASTVSGIDVSAGIDADPGRIESGPAKWIGGVKIATEGSLGRAELAVRTSVRYVEQSRLIGVELGPRFERAFPGGLTFFVDGKAEAETAGSPSQRIWTPPVSSFDGLGSLGVVGRTGIVR